MVNSGLTMQVKKQKNKNSTLKDSSLAYRDTTIEKNCLGWTKKETDELDFLSENLSNEEFI